MTTTDPLTAADRAGIQYLPVCGHWACADKGSRISVLDDRRDVVIFHGCDGIRHVFRDHHDDGLIWRGGLGKWTLTRETHTATGTGDDQRWHMAADAEPICAGAYDHARGEYLARHLPTRRVIARCDTAGGLLARAARFYLRATPPAQAPS